MSIIFVAQFIKHVMKLNSLIELDDKILYKLYNLKTPWYLPVDLLLFLGSLIPTLILLIGSFIYGIVQHDQTFIFLSLKLAVTFLVSSFTFITFKEMVNRFRPYAQPRVQEKFNNFITNRDERYGGKHMESFPSGHVFISAMLMVVLFSQFGIASLPFTIPFVISMVFLRIHLGVHFPSDTMAGLFLGIFTGVIACYALSFLYSLGWEMVANGESVKLITIFILTNLLIIFFGKRRK